MFCLWRINYELYVEVCSIYKELPYHLGYVMYTYQNWKFIQLYV